MYKNILIINSSHDGATSCLIDDLSKLDVNDPTQKNIKDIIEKILDDESSKTNTTIAFSSYGDFELSYGQIYDISGYGFINMCHDVFGMKNPPYTVEHEVFVKSHI